MKNINKKETIVNIQKFLEGKNERKYLVNVEVDVETTMATCVFQEPNKEPEIEMVPFVVFMYIKDFEKNGKQLYGGDKGLLKAMMVKHGIKVEKLKTANHPRLEDGYCYKVISNKSYVNLLNFFKEGGIDPYQKTYENGKVLRDEKNKIIYKNKHLFYMPKLNEMFFISTGMRLFKGIEDYDQIHRLTFDIETTGLRPRLSRVFAIGIKDNRGNELLLEAEKPDDDEAEKKLIENFFYVIRKIQPAVITGHNIEDFDYEYLIERSKILKIDLSTIPTTRDDEKTIRRKDSTLKVGNKSENYMSTILWGYSVIDTNHSAKRTAAINSDIKNTRLKYLAKFEKVAKKNRTYIKGEDKSISKFWLNNNYFIINPENNKYYEIPNEYQVGAKRLALLQRGKNKLPEKEYKTFRKTLIAENPELMEWLKNFGSKLDNNFIFTTGKAILRQYLLDDLYETEKIDYLYNQSSFLLAKIIPTTYSRVATMGSAGMWNLLMTAWSYENDLAIPKQDVVLKEKISGGLARCYKTGYSKNVVKIDFGSLYPMEQLTWDIFPIFDIDAVLKKMLTYTTTTRNIFKKLANKTPLDNEEVFLLESIDHETYAKYINNEIKDSDRKLYKIKQLPIKILNNSLFGSLASVVAFNWSDNICAARITCTGRIYLRQAITYFKGFGFVPLLAVTDGVNFSFPEKTKIGINDGLVFELKEEMPIDLAWKYGDKTGLAAIVEKFNTEELKSEHMMVDNDGTFISSFNLSRINYALLYEKKNKETGEIERKIKLTGNTIKSNTMPEYIEEFIDKALMMILEGEGEKFVNYYQDYVEKLYYKQIPLKKIASKSKIKNTIKDYINRGKDKNGREKARQAHMELLILQREEIAKKIFEEKFEELNPDKSKTINDYDIDKIMTIVSEHMPPEPELDSMVYYVNVGKKKSHGDVKTKNGEIEMNAVLIDSKNLEDNPDLLGDYNVEKYIEAFNTRVSVLLAGFDVEIRDKIIVNVVNKKEKDASGKTIVKTELKKELFTAEQLKLKNFDEDDYEESMCLEKKEVDFWNKTGYNPRLIWDGFKINEEHPLLLEIYDFALDYLNNKMQESGFKKKIKNINEKLNKGDLVLLKDNNVDRIINPKTERFEDIITNIYHLGYFNGEYIEIKKQNIDVPKSPIEIEWDKKREELNKKLEKLKVEEDKIISKEQEKQIKENEKLIEIFKLFKKKFEIPMEYTMEMVFAHEKAKIAFEDFYEQTIKGVVEEDEYDEYDDDGDYI